MVPSDNPWSARLSLAAYACGAILLVGYAIWHYLMGEYAKILLPAILSLLMICAIFLRLIDRAYRRPAAYLALIACYLLMVIELPYHEQHATLWLGLPPMLTALFLPLGPALLLNLALAPVWWITLLVDMPLLSAALHYFALVMAISSICWWRQCQKNLLRAIDPLDRQCDALSRQALMSHFATEFERTEALDQPLSVLLIHLPQLEMAEEQFGSSLLHELLDRLCSSVHASCRRYDLLGRQRPALFWLLLPDTGEAGALIVRERLLRILGSEVLTETGPIQIDILACHLLRGEDALHFEQRLLATGMKLMEPSL